MSASRRQEMHVNSLLAWFAGQKDLFSKRESAVLEAVRSLGNVSDREVMIALGFTDMNSVRPRLTELVDDGVLEEVGVKTDPVTRKQVRVLALKRDPRKPQAEFRFTEEEKAS